MGCGLLMVHYGSVRLRRISQTLNRNNGIKLLFLFIFIFQLVLIYPVPYPEKKFHDMSQN